MNCLLKNKNKSSRNLRFFLCRTFCIFTVQFDFMYKFIATLFIALFSFSISAQDAVSSLTYKGELQTREKNNWRSYEQRFFGGEAFKGIDTLGLKAIEFYVFKDSSRILEVLYPKDTTWFSLEEEVQDGIEIMLTSNFKIESKQLKQVSEIVEVAEEVEETIVSDFGSDFKSKPKRKKKKIQQWHVVQEIKNKPGQYILIIGWVDDLTKFSIQKAFLKGVMKELNYKSFDAMSYYAQHEQPTEKTIVGFAEEMIKALITKDTLVYYSHLANVNDFDYFVQKVSEILPAEEVDAESKRKGFIRDFNKHYNLFGSLISELKDAFGEKKSLNDFTFEIECSKRKKYGFVQYRIKIHLKLKNDKEVYLKFRAIDTPRGLVLSDNINSRFKEKYSVKLTTNMSKAGVEYRMSNKNYFDQPILSFVKDFQSDYTHWKHENGTFVLYSNEDKVILEGSENFKNQSFQKIENALLKKVTVIEDGKSTVFEKSNTIEQVDCRDFSTIEFTELFYDKLLQRDMEWLESRFADTNDLKEVIKLTLEDAPADITKSVTESLGRNKGRIHRSFKNALYVSKAYFKDYDNAIHPAWSIFHKEELDSLPYSSSLMIGYMHKGLSFNIKGLCKTEEGFKFTKRIKMKWESFNEAEIPGLFTKDNELEFVKENAVTKTVLTQYLKEHESEIVNWKYKYRRNKLVYIEFTQLEDDGKAVRVVKNRLYLSSIPESFYEVKIQHRRLYQLRNAKVSNIKYYDLAAPEK